MGNRKLFQRTKPKKSPPSGTQFTWCSCRSHDDQVGVLVEYRSHRGPVSARLSAGILGGRSVYARTCVYVCIRGNFGLWLARSRCHGVAGRCRQRCCHENRTAIAERHESTRCARGNGNNVYRRRKKERKKKTREWWTTRAARGGAAMRRLPLLRRRRSRHLCRRQEAIATRCAMCVRTNSPACAQLSRFIHPPAVMVAFRSRVVEPS